MTKDILERRTNGRAKAVSMAMRRKEEYLGARVPKELRDKVIQKAKCMGIPVSILIRNILEEAFEGEVVDVRAPDGFGGDVFCDVIGWEEITLNKSVNCAGCGVQLDATRKATLGLGGDKPIVICNSCKSKL